MTWSRRVVRRFIIHLIEAVAVVFAGVAIVCGVVLWRMSQGPVDLAFLEDRFSLALVDAFGGEEAALGDAKAEWSPEDRSVMIVLSDVVVEDDAGAVIAQAERFEAGLSLSALLRGRLAFSGLEARGGMFSIVRDEFGAVTAGLGRPEQALARRGRSNGESHVENVFGPQARGGLSEFSIAGATLFIRDEMTGLDWRAENATLGVARDGDSIRARAVGDLAFEGAPARLEATARASGDLRQALFEVRVTDLVPAAALPSEGPLSAVARLDAPVQIEASAALGRRGLLAGDLTARIGGGALTLPGRSDAVRGGLLRASYDPSSGAVVVDEFSLQAGATTIAVQARIERAIEVLAGVSRGVYPVHLEIGESRIDARPAFENVLEIDGVVIDGALDVAQRRIRFDSLIADIRGVHGEFTGEARLVEVEGAGLLPAVELEGPITGETGYRDVLDFWPVALADGARNFLVRALKAGRISDANLTLDLPAEAIAAKRLDDDGLSLTFAFSDAEVAFVATMSPLRNGAGTAELKGNSFTLALESGRLAGIDLTSGHVEIPRLNPKGAPARFGARGNGAVRDVIAFIDEPPLRFPTKYGLAPDDFGGTGTISFDIIRPMYVEVPPEDYDFSVSGSFTGVSGPSALEGFDITEADVEITADRSGLVAKGAGRLGPAPATLTWTESFSGGPEQTRFEVETRVDSKVLDGFGVPSRLFLGGEADLTISTVGRGFDVATASVTADLADARLTVPGSGWRKPAGEPATARFDIARRDDGGFRFTDARVEAESVRMTGAAELRGDGRLERLALDELKVEGFVDAALNMRRGEDDGLMIDVTGASLDARGAVSQLVRGMGAGGGDLGAPLKVTARLDRALVTDTVTLRDLALDMDHDGARMRAFALDATSAKGPITARIAPDETLASRTLTASAPDAGELVDILFGVQLVEGGAVQIDGILPPLDAPKEQGAQALLTVEDFKLVGVPPLAQVLSVASLRGLADTLAGAGIAFDTLHAPMTVTDGVIALDEARAAGQALGITVSGELNLAENTADLDGVLVPAYSVNSALGAVPVLGDLLVSRRGEGVFALTYTIDGPFKETRVVVNPLSALAPGVLRRIFEGSSGQPPPIPETPPSDDSASN